jgi:hypothetical protein
MNSTNKCVLPVPVGSKKTSKYDEYKPKSIIRRKLSKLADKGLYLISSLSTNLKLNLDLNKNSQAFRPLIARIAGSNPALRTF